MNRIARSLATFSFILLLLLMQLGALPVAAQGNNPHPEVRDAVRSDSIEPLRERPILPPQAGRKNLPRKEVPFRPEDPVDWTDPVLQPEAGVAASTVGANFDGINNRNGVLPPDTNGDIGPNHYVQTVNLSFAVYSRTGALLYGPANGNTLWSGFGGPCQTENDGDPIVLYDHLADRWMISQFALPNYPNGPFYQCIAVSQTPDPTGGWYRYQFLASNTKMNDYPKFGVWPDGYYMTVNQFSAGSLNFSGTGAFVFERDKMLSGQSARMIYFDLASNGGGMLPADLDGPPPPAGTPNTMAQFSTSTQLTLWEFRTNWTTPASSTMQNVQNVTVAGFDANMCNYSRSCIPQPGTTVKLDAISDRLMYRLQYRNFGDHQTLVTNHTVDVGVNHAGVRWYELRKTTGNWGVQQQGTFAPDAAHRWMGSAAMNGAGDLALGYSLASSTIYPSIRVTGRLATDPAGAMTQGETVIVNGGGSQTHSASRWGDYSMMAVDPNDDCTFWYTTEYMKSTSSAGWSTRIASVKLRECGAPVDTPPVVTLTSPAQGATVSGTIAVTADAGDDNGVTQVEFFVDGASIGVDDSASGGWSATWDTTTTSDGTHTVRATATDTIGQTTSDSHNVTVNNALTVALTAPAQDATVSGTIPVSANATSPNGVMQVEFFVDGNTLGADTNGADGWSFAWDTTLFSDGQHAVSATATDAIGQTASDSRTVTVSNATPGGTMHLGALGGAAVTVNKNFWRATATIIVHDASHSPLSGVTVTGAWNPGSSGSCLTDSNGVCTIDSGNLRTKSVDSSTFTVSGLALAGYTDTGSDDPGVPTSRSIPVSRP